MAGELFDEYGHPIKRQLNPDCPEDLFDEYGRPYIKLVGNLVLEHHTALDTLTEDESGSVHTNLGAGGAIKLTLPQSCAAGTYFYFAVMAVQQLQIDPGAAGAIYINGAMQADDAYIWADDEAESVLLVADGNGDWVALFKAGTWTVV